MQLIDMENMNRVLVLLVDGQLKSHTSSQPQVPPEAPQPAAILTSTAATSGPTLLQSRFHWSHMLLAVGLLAASGAGTAVLFKVSSAVFPNQFLYTSCPLSTSYDVEKCLVGLIYFKLRLIFMFLCTG